VSVPRRPAYLSNRATFWATESLLTNLKLLVVGGLIPSIIECYGPLLCKVSGPRGGLVKHEDEGASPKMAKRLESTLGTMGNP
jgi:hypothetical protein